MRPLARVACALLTVAGVLMPLLAVSARGNYTQSQLDAAQRKARSLSGRIDANSGRLSSVRGSVAHVRRRLARVQRDLNSKQARLEATASQLRQARARHAELEAQLSNATRALSDNLVRTYEAGNPDVVTVIIESNGFADLLERANFLRRAQKQDAKVIGEVRTARVAVVAQAKRLGDVEARQASVTSEVLARRDQIARLQLALVRRAARYRGARKLQRRRLRTLTKRARKIARKLGVFGPGFLPGGGGFRSHGGSYGFFVASGTDYSYGDEPHLAARLDALGRALHLHLIGISGYRTPQHSVEVGGFANDPHTRGQASDTPGIEGAPERTLNRFGLTRPFPGAHEADHIQLLGGAR